MVCVVPRYGCADALPSAGLPRLLDKYGDGAGVIISIIVVIIIIIIVIIVNIATCCYFFI